MMGLVGAHPSVTCANGAAEVAAPGRQSRPACESSPAGFPQQSFTRPLRGLRARHATRSAALTTVIPVVETAGRFGQSGPLQQYHQLAVPHWSLLFQRPDRSHRLPPLTAGTK